MPRRNIYVRQSDLELWDKAEELARERGEESLSGVIANALRVYIATKEAEAEGWERIEVETRRQEAVRPTRKAFVGRWIIDPAEELESQGGMIGHNAWAVAQTKQGRIAIYFWDPGGDEAELSPYDSIDDAIAANGLPDDIADEARARLDSSFVVELDI